MSEPVGEQSLERAGVALLLLLAAALFLTNLGNHYLWQDEAQTALLARTILSHGIPLGFDGTNYFSQELGVEYGDDHVWKWHTWLSFYLVASSLWLFGNDAFAARLPFALFGIATVALTYLSARWFWRDRTAATTAALMLALCVPFLVLSRQSRYHSLAAFLSLLGLYAYDRLGTRGARDAWLLFAAGVLLFHTHYIYCAALLATLLLHALLFERQRLRTTFEVAAGVTLLSLPWILWFSTIRVGSDYVERLLELGDTPGLAGRYGALLISFYFGWGAFLLIPPLLAARRHLQGERVLAVPREIRSRVELIVLYCLVTVLLLSLLSPNVYFRYLTPLAPPLFLLTGLLVGSLLRVWPAVGVLVIAAWVAAGPMRDYVHELSHDYDGPIEGIVRFLEQHARPDDTVAVVYGDLPLKFYTGLRVIGGLTGEDLAAARNAEWIILRRHTVAPVSREVRETFRGYLLQGEYRRYEIDYPEIAFENREDPRIHRYRTVRTPRKVSIYGRER